MSDGREEREERKKREEEEDLRDYEDRINRDAYYERKPEREDS